MQEKSLKRHIDRSFEFYDGVIKPPKKARKIMPDLMADHALVPPCESPTKEVISVTQKPQIMNSELDGPYVPRPVQEKKKIFKSPGITPDPPKQKWERPKAEYGNTKSPYGIYDELKEEWNKKTG